MLVKANHQRSVVFLTVDKTIESKNVRVPTGTAFLVVFPEDSVQWPYVVTARHCIEDASSDDIYIRVNQRGPGFVELRTHRDDWMKHPNADVAAILYNPSKNEAKEIDTPGHVHLDEFVHHGRYWGKGLPSSMIEVKGGFPVSVGDDVYFIGLFYRYGGLFRNLPIARFGGVSRLIEEPLVLPRDRRTSSFRALVYLVECRSWGGQSGSPAFWLCPVLLFPKHKGERIQAPPGIVQGLLGIVSAHFEEPVEATVTGDILGKIETGINQGIAAITPAHYIRELLEMKELANDRKARKASHS